MPYQVLTQAVGGDIPLVAAGRYLDLLLVYCRGKGLPTITVLVVSAETGQPAQKSKHIGKLYRRLRGRNYVPSRYEAWEDGWFTKNIPIENVVGGPAFRD